MDRRATCLNCMDGRVQLPVLQWIKVHYPVDFVDVITEAGMDGVLAKQENIDEVVRSINVSINLNKSTMLFVVGHHDCRGNPVDHATHHVEIVEAVKRLRTICNKVDIIGLWVNQNWQVELVT